MYLKTFVRAGVELDKLDNMGTPDGEIGDECLMLY